MEYLYRAYGLTCLSDVPIGGFFRESTISQVVDVTIHLNRRPAWVDAAQTLATRKFYSKPTASDLGDSAYDVNVLGANQFFQLMYSDGTEFMIDALGRRVWGHSGGGFPQDYLETYLRGPIMGFVLRLRNVTALHASAVSVHGQAIVLCGESGSGKSTTAAGFALAGASVLCDDIVPVVTHRDEFFVCPGYPQIGLWPDAVQGLLGAADALPRWTANWEKCFLALDGKNGRFEAHNLPLGAIYLLAPRTTSSTAPRIEELRNHEALIELVQNTYMNWLLDTRQRAIEFDFLVGVLAHVPVKRVVAHSDPARMCALRDLVAEDVRLSPRSATIAATPS